MRIEGADWVKNLYSLERRIVNGENGELSEKYKNLHSRKLKSTQKWTTMTRERSKRLGAETVGMEA